MLTRNRLYLLFVMLGFLLCGAFWTVAVMIESGYPSATSRWMGALYQLKLKQSLAKPTGTLLVVSGSNSLFSVNARTIEKEVGIPTYNLGTQVGLGLEYILFAARKMIKPGDIVLMPLEYELYGLDDSPTTILVDHVFANDLEYFKSLNWLRRARLVLGMKPNRLMEGMQSRLGLPVAFVKGYDTKNINQNGDETSNLKAQSTIAKQWSNRTLKPSPLNNILTDHASAQIQSFSQWCKARNVVLLAAFPASLHFREYDAPASKQAIARIADFYSRLNIPVLGTAESFMYDPTMFYDTIYHLNQEGTHYRTGQLIALLRPYIQLSSLRAPQTAKVPPSVHTSLLPEP